MSQILQRSGPAPGAFSEEFARKKRWKMDAGLWTAIQHVIPPDKTVIELGAGKGRYVFELRRRGNPAIGLDGIPNIEEISHGLVRWADLTAEIGWSPDMRADWGICVETGEHIPPELGFRLLDNMARCARIGLVVTWAVPGQRGRNHVNCRPPEWVAGQLMKRGWPLDEKAMAEARKLAGKGWDRKLLVFRK